MSWMAKQANVALMKRGWFVAGVERDRKRKLTFVRFMHPLGWGGANIVWTDHELATHSSTEMLDLLVERILYAERIARMCPWPPREDERIPIALVTPPPHIQAVHEQMERGVIH